MATKIPLKTWLGRPDEEARLRYAAFDVPHRFIDAALANPFVRACRTEESIRQEPPVCLRFEEASAYGLLGECLCAVQSKSWGPLVGVPDVARSAVVAIPEEEIPELEGVLGPAW